MKLKLLLNICLLFLLSNITVAQVGIGTSSPKGILDIDSSIYGVVYPSEELTSTIIAEPVLNAQTGEGLVVGTTIYNTNETFTGTNDVEPGIYSWNGSEWITHFFKRQSELFEQTTSIRTTTNLGLEDVPGLGVADGNTFTPKFSGLYKVELKLNYGAGDMQVNGDMNVGLVEGQFDFTFFGQTHEIHVKSYSTYNNHISGGTHYSNMWVETFKVIYKNLTAGVVYGHTLQFDQGGALGFVNDGNGGDGRGYVGEGIPCFIEFTYLQE